MAAPTRVAVLVGQGGGTELIMADQPARACLDTMDPGLYDLLMAAAASSSSAAGPARAGPPLVLELLNHAEAAAAAAAGQTIGGILSLAHPPVGAELLDALRPKVVSNYGASRPPPCHHHHATTTMPPPLQRAGPRPYIA